jgi:hypothetical protein
MATSEITAAFPALRPIDRDQDGSNVMGVLDENPVFYVDTAADLQAIAAVALTRLTLLDDWLRVLATSRSDVLHEPSDLAEMLRPMCQDVQGLLRVLVDRLSAERRAALAVGVAAAA